MFITTQNEIISLMPTARWDRPAQLFGYLEEEEAVALVPILGDSLYQHLISEYDRLRRTYVDITATTVHPSGQAKQDPRLAHADVTERLEQIQAGNYRETYTAAAEGESEVSALDLQTIRLIRICQRIEWYKMLSHKAGLLSVSFNEGGGMNKVSADGYEPATDKDREEMRKDAWMAAGRAIDDILLFLESDAKGAKLFSEKWSEADAFYLHKDLLFQTARVLNEYLDINGERKAYVALVRDIRFCQNTYLKPRIGGKLLKAAVEWANSGAIGEIGAIGGIGAIGDGGDGEDGGQTPSVEVMQELVSLLRTALAFYVEARRVGLEPVKEKMARRDSMTDAQQAMADACAYIEENIDALGDAVVGTPIYNKIRAREEQIEREKACACAAAERRRREAHEQNHKKLFTGFPATHRTPEHK